MNISGSFTISPKQVYFKGMAPQQEAPVSQDMVDLCRDLGPQAQPLPALLKPEHALDLQAPELKRPVLMVHGLAQQADTWVNMKNFLCANPANGYGGIYRAGQMNEFLRSHLDASRSNEAPPNPPAHVGLGAPPKPPAKVFIINLSDNLASPEKTHSEVKEALCAIRGLTGAKKIDVVTHSMGALTTREAMRNGADGIGNLLMIAPPNKGAYGANMLLGARNLGYHHYPKQHVGALEALRVEKGPLGGDANPWLHQLNGAWARDSHKVKATIITGAGLPTPHRNWKGTSDGDGMVALRQSPLGDTPIYVAGDAGLKAGHPDFRDFQMFRYNHLQIVSEAEVFRKVGEVLAEPLPSDRSPEPTMDGRQMDFSDVEPSFPTPPVAVTENTNQFNLF